MEIVLFLLILALYFLPTIIAVLNKHCGNKIGIFCLNLLLGWSIIGWIIALVMACGNTNNKTTIIVNNTNSIPNKPVKETNK